MDFGLLDTRDAEGAILAHSVRGEGYVFKKGRVLAAADIEQLLAAGVESLTGARLGPGDVHEDAAAAALAAALAGANATTSAPFTGRCNLFASSSGLLLVDAERVAAMNAIDEAITVATLAPMARVVPRQMLATVKIIPFAVTRRNLDAALAALSGETPGLSVAPWGTHRAGLIQTRVAGTRESVLDKTATVLRARLEPLGASLLAERRCAHDTQAVAAQVRELMELELDWVLLVGASAIVDRRDVLPAAIEVASGEVTHFGMPVDPGNLLLLGRVGATTAIGMPGCARSPKRNGLDLVLERLSAGQQVARDEFAGMGVGGLLKDSAARQASRVAPADEPGATAHAPRVAAVLLAAGQSRRMGARNKLLIEIDGRTMVSRAAQAVRASGAEWLIVVTGHEAEQVRAELAPHAGAARYVHNPDFADGLSTSLIVGLAELPAEADAVFVVLGDMPGVNAAHLDRLIAAFDPVEGREICVPTFDGKRGNPILFARRFLAEMQTVSGDLGARHLLSDYEDCVVEVPMTDRAVLTDIDSPEALASIAPASA